MTFLGNVSRPAHRPGGHLSDQRIDALERQMKSLRRQVQAQGEYIDTVSTPVWKRVWFVIQGYRFRRLGRWYKASWNASGAEWDDA